MTLLLLPPPPPSSPLPSSPSLSSPPFSPLSPSHTHSQIDTLLRDITVPLPESPPPTTLTLASWLLRNGLGACQDALETNGYDSLLYLGSNILVMDDLADIGLTSSDDQL